MRPKGVELPTFSIPSPMFYHSPGNASAITCAAQTKLARNGGKKQKGVYFAERKRKIIPAEEGVEKLLEHRYTHPEPENIIPTEGGVEMLLDTEITHTSRSIENTIPTEGRVEMVVEHRGLSHTQKYRKHSSHRGKGRNGG